MSTAAANPARKPDRPAGIISRGRLLAWLERHATARLRAIAAPPGFGKTTLIAEYLHARPACHYLSASLFRGKADRLIEAIDESFGAGNGERREVAIDEIDALSDDDLAALSSSLSDIPEHVHVIIASRSRDRIAEPRRLLDGTTAVLDMTRLAFNADDVAELCTRLGVEALPQHVSQLVRESDGWPLVAAGAVRAAADAGRSLADAMRLWIAERGISLREMVLADAGASDLGPALARLCTAESLLCVDDMQALERAGLYVRRKGSGFALLRPVENVFAPRGRNADLAELPDVAPMFVQLLGEFEVRIGGSRIEWIRRKDALLFKHLLLEPLGRVSRAELCTRFWPSHDRQQAAQNLRTTCSNVRTALRRCLPESRVDLYFRTEGRDVVLRNDLAVTDLSRFTAHIAAAREAMLADRLDRAAEAYESARALYRGPLIVDSPTDAHVAIAADIDESFNEIQRHLTALRRLRADAAVVPLRSVVA